MNSDNEIEKIIEVKTKDSSLSKNLQYFSGKYAIPAEQVVKDLRNEVQLGDLIKITKADNFLRSLYI